MEEYNKSAVWNMDNQRNLSYESYGLGTVFICIQTHTLITMLCKQSTTFGVPIFTVGMCVPDRILFHVCVRIGFIFVALSSLRMKICHLDLLGGDFISQWRWEATCWLLDCSNYTAVLWVPSFFYLDFQSTGPERNNRDSTRFFVLTSNGWIKVWS